MAWLIAWLRYYCVAEMFVCSTDTNQIDKSLLVFRLLLSDYGTDVEY